MTWQSPIWPINMKATQVIRGDAILSIGVGALLKGNKTYDSIASDTPRPKPHIVLGSDAETLGNTFGQLGRQVFCAWQIVGENKEQCELIYNELLRLFDGQTLVLADHVMVRGSLTSALGIDEEDLRGYRKLCEYAVHALRSAV